MADNCELKLTADIIRDCDNESVAGIEVNVVVINLDDVDKTASTIDATNDLIITDLATKSGTSGFVIEGIKQTQGISCELVKKENSSDKYKHIFSGVILSPSAANKKRLDEIASGGKYVVVVEKKFKGADQDDAFEVLGWNNGVEIATINYNSKEDDGVWKFEVSSAEGYEEPKMTRNLLETDYDTTSTSFSNKFATA